MKSIFLLFFISFGLSSLAGPFTITCTGSDCSNPNVSALITEMENYVNSVIPDTDNSAYIKGMADASIITGKGTKSDNSNEIENYLIGIGATVGVEIESQTFSYFIKNFDPEKVRGVDFQPGILLAAPMKKIGIANSNWFGNVIGMLSFMYGDYKYPKYNASTQFGNLGINFRYKLIKGKISEWTNFGWKGIFFVTGLEYSYSKIQFSYDLTQTKTDGTYTLSGNGYANLGATTKILSFPLELSSALQFLYVFTLYGGFGIDLNLGESEIINNSNTSFALTGGGITDANLNGSINLGGSGSPYFGFFRLFLGLQLNAPIVKLYTQVQIAPITDTYGVAAGLKFNW